jgi:hypothetical protein
MMVDKTRALRKPDMDMTEGDFRARFSALLADAPPHTLRSHAFFSVPANLPPWFDTGLDLSAGEQVTVIAVGRTFLSRELNLCFDPDMQLWYRIGDAGEVFRGTRCSHTFLMRGAGRLFFGNYFPGEWATHTGGISVGTDAYRRMEGSSEVLVVRWAVEPLEGLKRLAKLGDVASLLAAEIDRLEHPVNSPPGWEYLWFLGPAEIYTAAPVTSQRPSIVCYTHRDAGILHKSVSLPLTPDTRLRWLWKVDVLPSQSREDQLQNHDYVSIAVEFDNGQDLTYFWSSELKPETGFRCPIPTWTARETHVAVRSGRDELKRWCQEERSLYADYQRFIGTPGRLDEASDARVVQPPTRIVRIWLIANSMFRRQEGRCEYGPIELRAGERIVSVN